MAQKQITGGELALKGIFSKEFIFEIPSYQRPYAWTMEEAGTLFDDLYSFHTSEKNEIYFLGSIVLIKNHNEPKAEVIDGQQRLTTIMILLSTISSLFKSTKLQDEVKKYICEPGNEIEGLSPQSRLRLRARDNDFFEKHILGSEFNNLPQAETKSEAQINIKENCGALLKRLKEKFSNDDELLKFTTFLMNRCYMVVVATPSQQSAFRVFSVMNSRGLDLLPCDIIKADIIGMITDEQKRQKYSDKWEKLEDEVKRAGFNDLFGHIRMIYARVKAKQKLLDEFRASVLSATENKDPISFIDKTLEPFCDAYVDIKNCGYESSENAGEINDNLRWLGGINNSDWVPAAVLFFSKYKADAKYILWFIKKLERLAAYLHITACDINERITRYAEIIKEIADTTSSLSNPIKSIEITVAEQVSFLRALDGDIYGLTPPRRNYAILRLDSFITGAGARYDYSVLTIEHVLPQTVDPNSEWAKWWIDSDLRKLWLNRISNLVPLARKHNSAAQNYDFGKKKTVYFCGINGVTPYSLTTQVNTQTEWTPDIVVDRQQDLLKQYVEKWELSAGYNAEASNNKGEAIASVRNSTFDGQLNSASNFVQGIYTKLCDYVKTVGDDIVHDKLKFFASFKKGKTSFASVKINRAEMILYCKLDFDKTTKESGFVRNMTGVGHVSNYNPSIELTIRSDADFEKAKDLIIQAYKSN